MTGTGDKIRRIVSSGLALLLLSLSVAVPLMERADVTGVLAAESGHHASTCPHGHDHRICTQMGANLSVASDAYHHRAAAVVVRTTSSSIPASRAPEPFQEGPPSRAPPLA
jgi:hypothetical protein